MSGGMTKTDTSNLADIVMTSKGDMVDFDTARQRFGIGSTGQVLTVASALPTWATLTTADSVLTTQGDVLYESGSGLARLGFGTTGDVLTTKGTGANPVWETPSSGGLTVNKLQGVNTALFETTTGSFVATGLELTLSNESGGNALINATFNAGNTTNGEGARCVLMNDGVAITSTNLSAEAISSNSTNYMPLNMATIADTDGSVIEVYMKGAATAKMIYSATNYTPQIIAMEFY